MTLVTSGHMIILPPTQPIASGCPEVCVCMWGGGGRSDLLTPDRERGTKSITDM